MMLPSVVRVFFAIDLPVEAKQKIGDFILSLKKRAKSHGIRWVKPENLHITLQFLAEVQAVHLPKLVASVKAELGKKIEKSTLTLGEVHFFPSRYRPRVIVLDVLPQEGLAALSARIGRGIQTSDYIIEDRPFRAHLTLGRVKQPHEVDLGFLSEVELPEINAIEVTEVVLFRSEPHPEGSHYSVLEKIMLSAVHSGHD